ncbi:MAG: DUF1934 domain-containing protein [Butyrivibrio sp.]|nr:DUF1934 domain-containing protein [Butyrivibrio sp.]
MADRQVKVVITGTHKRPGVSHIEDTKSEAVGTYRLEQGTHVIEYEEYLEEQPGGASGNGGKPAGHNWQGGVATYNLVEIEPSEMRVTRKGSVDSSLRFRQGKEHVSEYKTPFGAMKSRVNTKRYAFYTLEKGNRLIAEAEYTVSMNGMEMSETTMRIDATFTST